MTPIQRGCRVSAILLASALAGAHVLVPAVIVVDAGCTLADAITAANTDSATGGCEAGSGPDELQLTADVTLTAALPAMTTEITVEGNGFTVARDGAAPAFRIFEVDGPAPVALSDVTVSNGDAGAAPGGGLFLSGDAGTVVLANSTLSGNAADSGGGIYSSWFAGGVTLVDSAVTENVAADRGGGIWHYSPVTLTGTRVDGNSADRAGGIYTRGYLLEALDGSSISGNSATDSGGGIRVQWYGEVFIENSTVSYNMAGASGGGIYMARDYGSVDYHDLTIVGSTLAGNTAGTDGGGIRLDGGAYYGGTMLIFNSTLSGNSATGVGGALHHRDGSYFTLLHSTLSGNSASAGGGLYSDFRAATLIGSIIANSPGGGNCAGGSGSSGSDNFDDDGSCPGADPITPGVDFETTLADNGGPTLTHALLPGSVAADAAGNCGLATDQRGFPRDDGACDSGSVELQEGGPCVLELEITSLDRGSGRLELGLTIRHNRQRTVTVPFRVRLEDRRGRLVTARTTPPITLEPGETYRRRMTLALPESLAPGRYVLRAEIDRMQQGLARASVLLPID